MYKFLLLTSLTCVLTACISEEERLGAQYQFQGIVQDQCAHNLGFKAGTMQYMQCNMFYENMFQYDINNNWSYSKINQIEQKIDQMNALCQNYWGAANISHAGLWHCVQQKGNAMMEEAKHARELKEQEEMLKNAIAAGQKEANDDARIQSLIDAERARVAQLTGKNPKKIYCYTSTKSNGYVKVKCK